MRPATATTKSSTVKKSNKSATKSANESSRSTKDRPASAVERSATVSRPSWDSTTHDLTIHRLSEVERAARKQRIESKNLDAARAELIRKREELGTIRASQSTIHLLL